jgi:ubiquinone/menaquinone biosynthesis C-methylase UbiE
MQRFFFGPIHSRILSLLDEQLGPKAPPDSVIDVGCGTGRLLRAAAFRWPTARLLGVDPAQHMVSEAQRLNSNATFAVSLAESLPFPDGAADVILTSMSFHHWADQERGIREVARVLRSGGFFCLADHAFVPAKLLGERVKSRQEIRALMAGAGLIVRRQSLTLPFILYSLAQKP